MKGNTIETIQLCSKIAKIVSKVIMIFSIVAACLTLVGLISLIAGVEGAMKIGGINIYGIIETEAGMSVGQMYIALEGALMTLAAEIVCAYFASRYFTNELDAGTPFTFEGAKEIFNLGIIIIFANIVSSVIASILSVIIGSINGCEWELEHSEGSAVLLGVILIFISYVFKYGAEIKEQNGKNQE